MPDDTRSPAPPVPDAPADEHDVDWTESFLSDRFGMHQPSLSGHAGPQPRRIEFDVEVLASRPQGWPAHWHLREKERILIRSGTLTVRIGDRRHVMAPGDDVRFPAGVAEEHAIFHHADESCRYIIVGANDPDEVCVDPDGDKVPDRSQGVRFERCVARDVRNGEDSVTV